MTENDIGESEIMTIKDVSKYLKMNERTVYKLIQAGQIPAARLGKQWRLDKQKLNEWIGFKMAEMPAEDLAHLEKDHKDAVIRIMPLLKEENIVFNFFATSKSQAIQKLVDVLSKNHKLTPTQRNTLLKAVMEREKLCSTAIGEGVAIPHPRDVVIDNIKKPLIAIGISKNGMDFESIDNEPTRLIFLLSAPRSDIHLK
jgi:PTS system nitrogen regulatory IIA component